MLPRKGDYVRFPPMAYMRPLCSVVAFCCPLIIAIKLPASAFGAIEPRTMSMFRRPIRLSAACVSLASDFDFARHVFKIYNEIQAVTDNG